MGHDRPPVVYGASRRRSRDAAHRSEPNDDRQNILLCEPRARLDEPILDLIFGPGKHPDGTITRKTASRKLCAGGGGVLGRTPIALGRKFSNSGKSRGPDSLN